MDAPLPNLRHLRAFYEASKLRSITQAASAVFLTQSAATQAIAGLETAIGSKLFVRVGARVIPSEAAQVYAKRVRRSLDMMEAGINGAIKTAATEGRRLGKEILPLLTMTQLKAFTSVGTTGSFTLAAKALGVAQPSTHRSSRELESIIGIQLFEKTAQGISLTRSGHALWQQVKLAFSELEQGYTEVKALAGESIGKIVVGCMPLARHYVMPEAIAAFTERHPQISIQIIEAPYPELLHGVRHGEIDFLVGALRESTPLNDITQEPLFRAALCIAARNRHPLTKHKKLSSEDLAGYPWILPPEGTPTRAQWEQIFGQKFPHIKKGLVESSSQVLIRGLLKNTDRLTLISRQQVQFEIESGHLTTIPFDMGLVLRDIGLTLRADWLPTADQSAFLCLLRQVSSQHNDY